MISVALITLFFLHFALPCIMNFENITVYRWWHDRSYIRKTSTINKKIFTDFDVG